MIHKGVEFSVTQLMPGVWKWRFQIGDRVFTGKTEAKLDLLAIRRVQLRIDRELNNLGLGRTPRSGLRRSLSGKPASLSPRLPAAAS